MMGRDEDRDLEKKSRPGGSDPPGAFARTYSSVIVSALSRSRTSVRFQLSIPASSG